MSDRELQQVIDRLQATQAAWGEGVDIAAMRADLEALYLGYAGVDDAKVEVVDAGGVPAERVMAPAASSDHAILHLHGGGFSVCSARSHRHLAQWISAAARAQVLVVDYRLVPEHLFPAQLEDARAAYLWLLDEGLSPDAIAVTGDSAGSGLVLALLGVLRDSGTPMPCCAALLSPWADLRCRGSSYLDRAAEDPVASREMALAMGEQYVGEGGDLDDPLASPVNLDFHDFPPLMVQCGSREVFQDDGKTVAERARQQGVEVDFSLWPGMIHQWHLYAAELDEARQAISELGSFIAGRMHHPVET